MHTDRAIDYAHLSVDGKPAQDAPFEFGTVCHDLHWADATGTPNSIFAAIQPGLQVGWRGPVSVHISLGEMTFTPEISRDFEAKDMIIPQDLIGESDATS